MMYLVTLTRLRGMVVDDIIGIFTTREQAVAAAQEVLLNRALEIHPDKFEIPGVDYMRVSIDEFEPDGADGIDWFRGMVASIINTEYQEAEAQARTSRARADELSAMFPVLKPEDE